MPYIIYTMKFFLVFWLCVIPYCLLAQVDILSNDATKFYPNGTQITYLTLSNYPTESDFLESVNSNLVKDSRIHRFYLYKDGKTCFFEADKDVSEVIILEAINEAYRNFYNQPIENQEIVISEEKGNNYVQVESRVKESEFKGNISFRSFKKSEYNGQYYIVGFKLEDNSDIEMIKKASRVLKEQGNLENMMIYEDIIFELRSYEPINADFVIDVFGEFGLKIENEFIK
jgi:hypothetical protein